MEGEHDVYIAFEEYGGGAYFNMTYAYTSTINAYVEFSIDMNNVEHPNEDYDNVVVNYGPDWWGWGITLSDEDGDGVYTGTLEVEPETELEYVVAVTGSADEWSGWGVIYHDRCNEENGLVTAGSTGETTAASIDVGCDTACDSSQ